MIGKADGSIHKDQRHAAALHSSQGTHHHVALQTIADVAALAQTGGIGKDELAVGVVHRGVDGVASSAGHIADNGALLAY